ncbi:glycoside hydrolase family 18 protein [Cristinia sonorae]|uniref:Glycoside hydrolase family 18 protein n=1 Tax=Cristinia sonorae TaxID=1940300 RepID=A0A8K0UWV2_9AGAR|nr:glycoside hydrolase family 18 protein [Cristinia sonorae]
MTFLEDRAKELPLRSSPMALLLLALFGLPALSFPFNDSPPLARASSSILSFPPAPSQHGFPIPPPPPPASKQGTAPARPQIMAYYPDWATQDMPPEKIDFDRFDWIDFAFAVPDDHYSFNWDGSDNGSDLLTRLVTAAHAKGKKVKVSIGGWTGSRYFSPATSNDANRKKLAANILALYNQYNLDGIDIDWEYPAQQGDKANAVAPNDTANYLTFLNVLRKTLPPQAKITAAAMTVPWAGPDGQPLRDMSQFASVLDWILIMNYDTWGSSSKPGPNSALNDACHNSTQPNANAVSSVQAWTQAGFPANQIVLGVPSYGYVSRSSATRLRTRSRLPARQKAKRQLGSLVTEALDPLPFVAGSLIDAFIPDLVMSAAGKSKAKAQEEPPQDDNSDDNSADGGHPDPDDSGDEGNDHDGSDDDNPDADSDSPSDDQQAEDVKTLDYQNGMTLVTNDDDGGTDNGQLQFRSLLRQGILRYTPSGTSPPTTSLTYMNRNVPNRFVGAEGFVRRWDACSNTPFLTSKGAKQVVTYDDPQSLEMKGMFAKDAGLFGVNMFDVHGDTDEWDLIDAVRRGLGVV